MPIRVKKVPTVVARSRDNSIERDGDRPVLIDAGVSAFGLAPKRSCMKGTRRLNLACDVNFVKEERQVKEFIHERPLGDRKAGDCASQRITDSEKAR